MWLVIFAALGACKGCQREAINAVDAGHTVRPNVELKMALLFAFPEYRGVEILHSEARLRRDYPGLTTAQRDTSLHQLHYTATDSASAWTLQQFRLEQLGPHTLQVSLVLQPESLERVYVAPAGLSSSEMGLYLPRGMPFSREVFELELHYRSTPARSAGLIRQAVSLLLANQQWRIQQAPAGWLDAGAEASDEQLEVLGVDGTVIRWTRHGGEVHVDYVFDAA